MAGIPRRGKQALAKETRLFVRNGESSHARARDLRYHLPYIYFHWVYFLHAPGKEARSTASTMAVVA